MAKRVRLFQQNRPKAAVRERQQINHWAGADCTESPPRQLADKGMVAPVVESSDVLESVSVYLAAVNLPTTDYELIMAQLNPHDTPPTKA